MLSLCRFQCATLVSCLLLCAFSSEAEAPVRQVLLLHSYARGNLTSDSFSGNFRADLAQRAGKPVNFVQIDVGPTGFVGASEQGVVDYVRSTFANRPKPDLIVTVGGPAAIFARKHRTELFPDTPLLCACVDERYLRDTPPGENETGVAVANDFPRLMDEILQLLPQTKQVFVVMGSGHLGRFWGQQFEKEFKRFHDRVTFIWSGDLSFPEIVRRAASLPSHSAIMYLTLGTDAHGGAYADERVLADLHEVANAPIFAAHSPFFGHGIVGGTLMSFGDLSRTTADVAVRILNGAPPGSISVPPAGPGKPVFDWRELKRWGIPETRLPKGSLVHHRNPSVWEKYKFEIIGGIVALGVQSLLIIGLLQQRRARRQAELDSRRNLALAAEVSRRQTMAALTSSIAHEIAQPIGSMICNAHALHMMVTADQATPDTMDKIVSDIERQGVQAAQIVDRHRTMLRSHQLDKKPIDLHDVISESLALVRHDMAERKIDAIVQPSLNACVISGDQVLLQQVLVNLMLNAMDAMAETPLARRLVIIRTEVRGAEVAVSVRDTGSGLPANINDTLFTPFVTTKANGLGVGLTIARTIVDAHGGTISAHNNPEGGATFTVTLRRSEMPKVRVDSRQNVTEGGSHLGHRCLTIQVTEGNEEVLEFEFNAFLQSEGV